MEYNISEIEKKLQSYTKTNTDGDELVLSSDFKLFFIKTIVDNQYISENILVQIHKELYNKYVAILFTTIYIILNNLIAFFMFRALLERC